MTAQKNQFIGCDKAYDEAVEFLRKRGYTNVSKKLYSGLRHQLINETGKMEVWNDILARLTE